MTRVVVFILFVSIINSQAETNSEALTKIWDIGKKESCSPEMRSDFNQSNFSKIKSKIKDENDRSELARVLNRFLFSFGYSHTEIFTDQTESYYLFKSLNADPLNTPLIINPGIQVGSDSLGFFVREVLDGHNAKKQGFKKQDRLLTMNGLPFTGMWGTKPSRNAIVKIMRQGQFIDLPVDVTALNWNQAFQDATLNSIKIKSYKGKNIGYVHLWSGVHSNSADALWTAIQKFKSNAVDGVILDLRGGYGGAFWQHLDPFFSDRKDFFEMTATDGNNQVVHRKPPAQVNKNAYLGPLIVLIDEGSRSGKEAMAYQFKKSHRAMLIGMKTPGYFSGGGLFLLEQPLDYILYLCVRRDSLLDGTPIEGIGISPDKTVVFDSNNELEDSQLKSALDSF